jgi:prepilin-type N-terminal cleavage/methylation domain-containing protein
MRSRRRGPRFARGFTLVELVVVLAILVMVLSLALSSVDGILAGSTKSDPSPLLAAKSNAPAIVAARASLLAVREAIDGPPERPGFLQDLRSLPTSIDGLFEAPALMLSGASVKGTPLEQFNPVTKLGWNGPYLLRASGNYHVDTSNAFTTDYGNEGDLAVIDPWGKPLVLQLPSASVVPLLEDRIKYARLVSAGPDQKIDTSPDLQHPNVLDPSQVGDDVVIYLFWLNGPGP